MKKLQILVAPPVSPSRWERDFPDGPKFFESHAGTSARECGEPGVSLLRESNVIGKESLEVFYSF